MGSDVRRWAVQRKNCWPLPCDSAKANEEQEMVLASDYDALKAERDKLAATVERMRALRTDGYDQNAANSYILRDNLDRALAQPVEDWKPCCLQHPHHVHCCHPERRTATIDRRRGYEHTYQADSDYYGTKHVRWCLAFLGSGPQLRTGQRRKS